LCLSYVKDSEGVFGKCIIEFLLSEMKETRSWGTEWYPKTTVGSDGGFGVPLGTLTIGYFVLTIIFLHGNDFKNL